MFKWVLKLIPKPIKNWIYKKLYRDISSYGICGDTELAFLSSYEQSFLKSIGGAGTLHHRTGLKQYNPFLIGAAIGIGAFGIAKLTGSSTRNAIKYGLLGFAGGAGISALLAGGTATAGGTLVGTTASNSALAGGTTAATELAAIQAATNPFIAGATTAGTTGNLAAGAGGLFPSAAGAGGAIGGTGGAILAPSAGATLPIAQGGAGLGGQYLVEGGKLISRPVVSSPQVSPVNPVDPGMFSGITENIPQIIKDNKGMALGIGAAGVSALSQPNAQQAAVPQGYSDADYENALIAQQAAVKGLGERAEYDDTDTGGFADDPYAEKEDDDIYSSPSMMAAKEGGIVTIPRFKEGGVNYLPSKLDHDEKDGNNYVRAEGYVEDGTGNGDKDEDTMLAQLADGEFVSRADAILGAGIMAGANPEDFKDMRKKGAAFFYDQQAKLKRIYDLVT
tara:strand:+ start:348 stop:1694 length:1347 start_codon:yes stop_codon:yes gene_type:complete